MVVVVIAVVFTIVVVVAIAVGTAAPAGKCIGYVGIVVGAFSGQR